MFSISTAHQLIQLKAPIHLLLLSPFIAVQVATASISEPVALKSLTVQAASTMPLPVAISQQVRSKVHHAPPTIPPCRFLLIYLRSDRHSFLYLSTAAYSAPSQQNNAKKRANQPKQCASEVRGGSDAAKAGKPRQSKCEKVIQGIKMTGMTKV